MASSAHPEVISAWYDAPDGSYQLGYCSYNAFDTADIQRRKGRATKLQLFGKPSLDAPVAELPLDHIYRANTNVGK